MSFVDSLNVFTPAYSLYYLFLKCSSIYVNNIVSGLISKVLFYVNEKVSDSGPY